MRPSPPHELVELLSRLELVRPADLRAAARHARRLAKDLTLFDSVWVDALVQARKLTPFQAAEINAGRSEQLRVGPYVLLHPLPSAACTRTFRARSIDADVDIRLSEATVPCDQSKVLPQFDSLIERCQQVAGKTTMLPILKAGCDGGRLWVASPWQAGRTAAEWLTHGGRMPGDVVLEVARQMCATLALCEAAGLLHGDISAQRLILDPLGGARLVEPGLRSVLRQHEADAGNEIEPEAFDYLSPERLSGAPNSPTSEIYSCALLWWHLLAGRAPRTGATASARRECDTAARLRPIEHVAPDTPRVLVKAIALATAKDPLRRPENFAALLDLLGPPSDRGQALVARYVAQGASPPERLVRRIRTIRRSPHTPTWAAAAGGVMLACALGTWPLWQGWVTSKTEKTIAAAHPKAIVDAAPTTPVAKQAPHAGLPQPVEKQAAAPIAVAASEPTRVVPTSSTRPVATPDGAAVVAREFVIAAARPVPWSQIRPHAGQVIRSRAGERAQVILPPEGASLAVDDLRFEDIDFVMPRADSSTRAALLLTASRTIFVRCSLRALEAVPTAIDWSPSGTSTSARPVSASAQATSLALRECVIAGPCAAVRPARLAGSMLSLDGVLFVGSGPLLSVGGSERNGPCEVQLKHCTVRGAQCVIALSAGQGATSSPVHVDAHGCVFAPRAGGPVLLINGGESPAALLRSLVWQGDGSVVTPDSPIVLWRPAAGPPRAVADAQLKIEGLVRSKLGFAGEMDDGPDASRLVSWQVPLRASQPPGIGEISLALPKP